MAMMGENTGFSTLKGAAFGLSALLFAAACERENAKPDAPELEETASPAQTGAAENAPAVMSRAPVPEAGAETNAAGAAGDYRLAWSVDAARCENVVGALNDSADDAVQWTKADEGVATAMFDYFNDGVGRAVERRAGMLAGNRIVTLWVDNGAGEFLRLDFGHAGANTKGLPAIENLHTKLTYAMADVIDISGNYLTVVTSLRDIDPSGDAYVINWRAKDGRAPPFGPRNYYPYVECLIAPANGEE